MSWKQENSKKWPIVQIRPAQELQRSYFAFPRTPKSHVQHSKQFNFRDLILKMQ